MDATSQLESLISRIKKAQTPKKKASRRPWLSMSPPPRWNDEVNQQQPTCFA